MKATQGYARTDCTFSMLKAMVADSRVELSLGAYGAVGQIAREPRMFVEVSKDCITAATGSSTIHLRNHKGVQLIAFEMLSSDANAWNCVVAICLPERDARMSMRTELTIVGQDTDAIFSAHRTRSLMDIGIGKAYADICVRPYNTGLEDNTHETTDERLTRLMQRDDCVWIFNTSIGRIETKDRRRRHFVPQLLESGDTHAKTAPIPAGYVPVGYAFPQSALHPETEDPRECHSRFQAILDQFGIPEIVKFKRKLEAALEAGLPAASFKDLLDHPGPPSRVETECTRVVLRQRRWLRGGQQLPDWEAAFDRPLSKSSAKPISTRMEMR